MVEMTRRKLLGAALAIGVSACSGPSALVQGNGRRVRLAQFQSRHVAARDIDIWIPDAAPGQRLRVLYAHDGQNLFDAAASYSGVPWAIDAAMLQLAREGVEPAIVVGIFNSPARAREYNAAGMLPLLDDPTRAALATTCGGPLLSDAYLRFVVDELKPHIDANFPTRPERAATFMLGSSMGGLVSLEALRAYPQVFRGAACLSAHLLLFGPAAADPGFRPPDGAGARIQAALRSYAAQAFPVAHDQRIWIDRGTLDLDALYPPFHKAFLDGLEQRGYRPGPLLQARVFDQTGHHESWWAARCASALRHLLA